MRDTQQDDEYFVYSARIRNLIATRDEDSIWATVLNSASVRSLYIDPDIHKSEYSYSCEHDGWLNWSIHVYRDMVLKLTVFFSAHLILPVSMVYVSSTLPPSSSTSKSHTIPRHRQTPSAPRPPLSAPPGCHHHFPP